MDEKLVAEYNFKGKGILLADDNDLNCEVIRVMLKSKGFIVECAKNGKDAITIFNCSDEGEFCAILMDTTMPIYDGINATRIIRESSHPQSQTIPIIAVTALKSEEEYSSAIATGMNDYLIKPFDCEKLMEVLAKHIK